MRMGGNGVVSGRGWVLSPGRSLSGAEYGQKKFLRESLELYGIPSGH